jgi:hypothetical protein
MLHHLAQAAALLLFLELLVVIFVFVAISGGLAWGLGWVRNKQGWVYHKIHTYVPVGTNYVHLGTDFVAKPFHVGGASWARVSRTASAIRTHVRELHVRRVPFGAIASHSTPPPVSSSGPDSAP